MEDLLLQLIKEARNAKLPVLKKAAEDAHDLLESQQGLLRDQPHELRTKCLRPFQLALETKRNKLITLGLNGLHKILRDDRFQSSYEPEDDSLWLPAQMLNAMGSILSQTDDTQTDMLKVLLQVACCPYWTMNGRLIIAILTTCSEAFEHGNQAVRTAAQAATSQTLRSYCLFLDEECREMDENAKNDKNLRGSGVSCFNEVLPILQYICCKLDEAQNAKNSTTVVFLLECLHTLLSSLPQTIYSNTHFTTFLWQKFCPALIAFLGTPRVDKNFTSRESTEASKSTEIGRGSGYLTTSLSFDSHQAKTVYSIGTELVRLVGCVGPLRPVLESVFHRMLLYPPPQQRAEPLKALKELLRSSSRMVDFAGPLLVDEDKSGQMQSDMALMRLVMDSIEESISGDMTVLHASVSCVVAMLSALQELSEGKAINHQYTCTINALYEKLESCDYRGPLTYQCMARLPKTYREQLELMKSIAAMDSDSSGHGPSEDGESTDTEGPSNESDRDAPGTNQSIDLNDDKCSTSTEHELASAFEKQRLRLERLPKCLHVGRQFIEECNIDIERHNARLFVKTLKLQMLPKVLALRSNLEVDEALQHFASNYCEGVFSAQQSPLEEMPPPDEDSCQLVTIMNADGIYLATYASLLLNLQLIRTGYYEDDSKTIPISEKEFVEEVHGSGVLVYLSATWLSELYQQVLACNFLEVCGYNPLSTENNALINVLVDVDGIPTCQRGGQLLSDYLRLEKAQIPRTEPTPEEEAGIRLSRRILTCCWDSMVAVLTAGLNPAKEENGKSILSKDDSSRDAKDTIVLALEGLHKAAALSNILGLQTRCGTIFSLLAKSACSEQSISRLRRTKDVLKLKLQNKITNLHTSHALSMEILLSKGLELGSHGNDCWAHVFTCCLYVSKMEHDFFGKNQNLPYFPKVSRKQKSKKERDKELQRAILECKTNSERLKLSFNILDEEEEDTCIDVYSFLSSPFNQSPMAVSIHEIIKESKADNQFNGILPADYAAKIICRLSYQVDRLFEDAALKLNLRALCAFLTALCKASKDQLYQNNENKKSENRKSNWWRRNNTKEEDLHVLLLTRVGEVMLKCVRSGRPLVHIMKAWSIVGPHFMEAACHKDRRISKKAVQSIHDTITALLNDQLELPHFHFNEALFKPFENLLCLELCDIDVQDQIVSCICEFVETNKTEIRSGWRPLFGALKAASVSSIGNFESAPVLEVFRVFLATENPLVFANAALDCILCLLRHVQGFGEACNEPRCDPEIVTTPLEESDEEECRRTRLCLESLKYLLSCSAILASMYKMPTCPIFHSAQRIQVGGTPQFVDSAIPYLEITRFDRKADFVSPDIVPDISYELLSSSSGVNQITTLPNIDRPSGVLKVWYILIEGLASAVMVSPRKYQPYILETLFHLLRNTLNTPGPLFALYCVNHLLLPMVQNWLRKSWKIYKGWENFAPNFKHCCGMTTDLVVDIIEKLQGPEGQTHDNYVSSTTLMLKQLFLVLTECIVQPTESIARLGCACIRHVLTSSGPYLRSEQWQICGVACHRACSYSLQELHRLTMAYSPGSESFYGDITQIKIAARKDATPEETERLRQLATQVFLVEEQRSEELLETQTFSDEKSYVFLLYSPSITSTLNSELFAGRVQMRDLVVGLLVHQMLLQCMASVLIQNPERLIPSLAQTFLSSMPQSPKDKNCKSQSSMDPQAIDAFLAALDLSYVAANKFDSRPGLKYLLQKVANLQRPANLYCQASSAWIIKILVLLELCVSETAKIEVDFALVNKMLSCSGKSDFHLDLKYRSLLKYLNILHITFNRLCNTYIEIIRDKNGQYSRIDVMCERKFFLLVSQPDSIEEIDGDDLTTSNGNRIVYSASPVSSDCGQDGTLHVDPAETHDHTSDSRSYASSELPAVDYSSDSGPPSEAEGDDQHLLDRHQEGDDSKGETVDPEIIFLKNNEDNLELSDSTEKLKINEMEEKKNKSEVEKSNERVRDNGRYKPMTKEIRRYSEDCLLSRRYNLKFALKRELSENEPVKENEIKEITDKKFRSKSLTEIQDKIDRTQSLGLDVISDNNNLDDNNLKKDFSINNYPVECDDSLDGNNLIKNLLDDYEKSKRNFRTNPFLQDETEKMVIGYNCMNNMNDNSEQGTQSSKDSEIHRKSWATVICVSLDWAQGLPDDRLAPILPALVGGVRLLTEYTVDSLLNQRIASFLHRVVQIHNS